MLSAVTPGRQVGAERGHDGRGDVVHVHEVAALPTVLEDPGRLPAGERAGEQRGDPGVRGVPRHAGPVDVVEPQGDAHPAGLPRPAGQQVLAVDLGGGVGVPRVQRRVLADQAGDQVRAAVAGTSGSNRPCSRSATARGGGPDRTVPGTGVGALAVDDHRGGEHDPGDALGRGRPQHHRGAVVVVPGVVVDVVQVDARARPWPPGGPRPHSPPARRPGAAGRRWCRRDPRPGR